MNEYLSILISIVLLILYIYYILPEYFIDKLSYYYSSVIFKKTTNEKIISLTIDDAPNEFTDEMLDILKFYKVSATFFIIGDYVKKYDPQGRIIKRIINEGHEIGNHMMFNHSAFFITYDHLEKEIIECNEIIKSFLPNVNIKYFRFGSGFFNRRILDIVQRLGYKLILGNIYCHDCHIRLSFINIQYIMLRIKPGSIIILHNLKHSIRTLSNIIPQIKNREYNIVNLSKLLK